MKKYVYLENDTHTFDDNIGTQKRTRRTDQFLNQSTISVARTYYKLLSKTWRISVFANTFRLVQSGPFISEMKESFACQVKTKQWGETGRPL